MTGMMRFFRSLLYLYPASFRAEYEEELSAIFARRLRDAAGWPAVLLLAIEVSLDTLSNAARVHWDILYQDLHYALRLLARAPGFTLTAIAVAALGIGATTAAFTVTDHVLIRPLPFADSNRLVMLWEDQSPTGYADMEPSPANYRDWKRTSTSFETIAAYFDTSANLVGVGEPERLEGTKVTADLFATLGVQPAMGRLFTVDDTRAGAPGTVILSNGLWKRHFGGDRSVLGRKLIFDDDAYLVIGVMPEDFRFPSRTDEFWMPARFSESAYVDRTDNFLNVIARLKRGVALERARAEMRTVSAQIEKIYPKENLRLKVTINPLQGVSQKSQQLLMALLGAAFCVLLIACANLANLLLARALTRRKELAVRTALGVGRERLVRQLLTESLLLAFVGGLFGVLLAWGILPLLTRFVPTTLPIAEVPPIDLRVLAFALMLASFTGIGFGVIPALRACGSADSTGLREGSRGGVGGRKERLRWALVVAEVAGSVVLLVSAGLLIRALWRLQSADPGFRPEGVVTLATPLPTPKYAETGRRVQFYSSVLADVRALPGVSDAAFTSFLPILNPGGIWHVTVEGRLEDVKARDAGLRFVTPGFFDAMGISLLQGRDVSEADRLGAPLVAVVSESFVRKYWPGQNPLGRRFEFAYGTREVVGVVNNIRVRSVERNTEPQVYLPYRQVPDGALVFYAPKNLVVRSSVGVATLLPALRRIIGKADPGQPVSQVRLLADIVSSDTAPRAVQVRVLGAFAAIAFLLAGIGLHGLLSFTVASRSQEFGVRMALGAQRRDILGMVMRDGVWLAVAGILPGVTLAYVAARSMSALLAGVTPGDAPTFVVTVTLCFGMTLAGSFLPALRAIRLDPTIVMRAE